MALLDTSLYPQIQPDTRMPDDTIRVQTNPLMFGGGRAEGLAKLGQAEEHAGNAAFQVADELDQRANELTANDVATKTMQLQAESWARFSQLRGQNAMNSLQGYLAEQKKIADEAIGTAPNPDAARMIANIIRTQQRRMIDAGVEHANGAFRQYQDESNSALAAQFGANAVMSRNNFSNMQQSLDQSDAVVTKSMIDRGFTDKTSIDMAVRQNRGRYVQETIEQIAREENPLKAQAVFDHFRDQIDPASVVRIEGFLTPQVKRAQAEHIADVRTGVAPDINADSGISPNFTKVNGPVARIESNYGQNLGTRGTIFQFGPNEQRQYGVNPNSSPEEQESAMQRYTADHIAYLRAHNIPVNDVTAYMAHQQGAAGAEKLMTAPSNAIAADVVGHENAQGNRSFFYDSSGRPLTVAESKAVFAQKVGGSPQATPAQIPDEATAIAKARADAQALRPDDLAFQQQVVSTIKSRYSTMRTETAGERGTLASVASNLTDAAMNGRQDIDFPEDRIRAVFPPDKAQQMIDEFHIAQNVGNAMRGVQFGSPEDVAELQRDIASGQGVLSDAMRAHARTASTGPGTVGALPDAEANDRYFRFSSHAAEILNRQINLRNNMLVGPHADPAAYVAAEPSVAAAAKAAESDPSKIADWVSRSLAVQSHLGVPDAQQHVLTRRQAQDFASKIMTPGADARSALQGLQQQFGPAWPHVFKDLVTLGGLPTTFQAVASLPDANDAQLLSRALQETTSKDKGFGEALGRDSTGKPISEEIRNAVESSQTVSQYKQSLAVQGISRDNIDAIGRDIQTLAAAKVLWGGMQPNQAAQSAIDAFTKQFRFMTGGARVPADQADAIQSYADQTLRNLTVKDVQVPPGAFGGHGQPSPQDYVANIVRNPRWVNTPAADGLLLMDYTVPPGRVVRRADGSPFTISFDQAKRPALSTASMTPGDFTAGP